MELEHGGGAKPCASFSVSALQSCGDALAREFPRRIFAPAVSKW
jgi:hypothetical protein